MSKIQVNEYWAVCSYYAILRQTEFNQIVHHWMDLDECRLSHVKVVKIKFEKIEKAVDYMRPDCRILPHFVNACLYHEFSISEPISNINIP